jgi:prephenate dehydrogenase
MDMLIIALYPKAVITALDEYAPLLKKGCIVMDCCGNKTAVVNKMQELSLTYPDLIFVGAHPMAGREFSGIKHSTVGLYDRASMLLVPINADIKTLAFIKQFILSVGFGSVIITTAKEHDEIIAYTSQLAHIVSSSYIKSPTAQRYVGFSAGSFRDMTRVARLSPEMWSQLTVENSDNLVKEITYLQEKLEEYKTALKDKDAKKVYDLLADGNEKKLSADKAKNSKIEN